MLRRFAFLFLKGRLNLKYLQWVQVSANLTLMLSSTTRTVLSSVLHLISLKAMKALFKIGIYFCNPNREGKNSFCLCLTG